MTTEQFTTPVRLHDMVSLGRLSNFGMALESAQEAIVINPPEHFEGRVGYIPTFLGNSSDFPIDLPTLEEGIKNDLVPLLNGSGHILSYTNFSVAISKSRRMAFFTACNIDGSNSRKIRREADKWYYSVFNIN